METEMEKRTHSSNNTILIAIVSALAFGGGVMGTVLWVQNRPATVAMATAPVMPEIAQVPPGLPAGVRVQNGAEHTPPPELTTGMSERQATLTLANWHYDHHQHELAVKKFRRVIQLGVTHPNVRTDLGNALRLNGQPKEALEQYRLAQKQDPTHELSLFNQGALYATSMNNRDKAIEVWKAYLKRFPKGQHAQAARSLIARAQSDK